MVPFGRLFALGWSFVFVSFFELFFKGEDVLLERVENVFRALSNVRPSQLADRELFDFAALGARDGAARDVHDWLGAEPQD